MPKAARNPAARSRARRLTTRKRTRKPATRKHTTIRNQRWYLVPIEIVTYFDSLVLNYDYANRLIDSEAQLNELREKIERAHSEHKIIKSRLRESTDEINRLLAET